MTVSPKRQVVPFQALRDADLFVDAEYQGGEEGNIRDDALTYLMQCGTSGGFRYRVRRNPPGHSLVVLYTTGRDVDWPDALDKQTGTFTYYGDQRKPGHDLHDTQRRGNQLLRETFDSVHSTPQRRDTVPPFFVFQASGRGRGVIFRGLAAPGGHGLGPADDLVAVWRVSGDMRFQNYRARFTILNEQRVSRLWINDLLAGNTNSSHVPEAWRDWVAQGRYRPLEAERRRFRPPGEQLPTGQADLALLRTVYEHFIDRPTDFEYFAVRLWQMCTPGVLATVTRPVADGGRDAVGEHAVGPPDDPVKFEFSLEAKCYAPTTSVGVRDTSRLISRLLHRQYGVLVTTSHVAPQAYQEIREDRHPVVIISGGDVVDLLKKNGYGRLTTLRNWLASEFPKSQASSTPGVAALGAVAAGGPQS